MSVELGRRIRGLRRLKGFTQQELADQVNISVSLLSNIERGLRRPKPLLLEQVALTLDVPAEELFFLPAQSCN